MTISTEKREGVMATDRGFSHPNLGSEVRIAQSGREVHLILVCSTQAQSDALCEDLLIQLKVGALNMTLMGNVSSVTEERP